MPYICRAFLFISITKFTMKIEQLYTVFLEHSSVQTDTRKIKKDDLFFALKGANFNGNSFAKEALEKGAAFVIIDEKEFYIDEKTILVNDVLETLQQLAKFHREFLNTPIIAITGSNGKTTTKELLFEVLKEKYEVLATEGNLNNHIGVPITLLKLTRDHDFGIIEMGANHQKEIEAYCKWALPNFGLINNCGKAHLEGFGGIEGVRKGKGELYDFIKNSNGIIFRNADLDYLIEMSNGNAQQFTYGSVSANVLGKNISEDGMLKVAVISPKMECVIETNLVGDYNFDNVMAAVAVGSYFGVSINNIKKAIENYFPNNNRSQKIVLNTNTIIMDAYNANPSSMKAAIENFSTMTNGKGILFLGAMKELGNETAFEHDNLQEILKNEDWEKVVLVGKEFNKNVDSFEYFDTSIDAKKWFMEQNFQHKKILIKGSRTSFMEKIIEN